MTTFTLDAGFEQPGIQFLDAAGNPMAAGVRVRLYPQNAQIIDQNIVAQDWTRAEGICPSLNPPAGTYWAYFRGRQGPETPLLITVPDPTPPPQLGFSGSLTATKIPGNTGYFRITGPNGLAYSVPPAAIQVDTANGAIVQIDDSGAMQANPGTIVVLSNGKIQIGGNGSVECYAIGTGSSGGSNAFLTVSNSGQILVTDQNEGGVTIAGLVDGAGSQILVSPDPGPGGAFVGGNDETCLVNVLSGSTIKVANNGFINQYGLNQTLNVSANSNVLCTAAGIIEQWASGSTINFINGASVSCTGNGSNGGQLEIGATGTTGDSLTVDGGTIDIVGSGNNTGVWTNNGGTAGGSLTVNGALIAHNCLLALADNGTNSPVNGTGNLTVNAGVTLTLGTGSSPSHMTTMAGSLTFDRSWTQQAANSVTNIYNGHLWSDFTSAQGAGHSVNFTDNSFVQTGDSIASWSWNFGDSNTSTSQNPSHTYASAGTYTVKLTISDGTNSSDCSVSVVVS